MENRYIIGFTEIKKGLILQIWKGYVILNTLTRVEMQELLRKLNIAVFCEANLKDISCEKREGNLVEIVCLNNFLTFKRIPQDVRSCIKRQKPTQPIYELRRLISVYKTSVVSKYLLLYFNKDSWRYR